MGLLPRVRIVVDKPDLDIAPEVAQMMKRKREKKDQAPRYFTTRERLIIFVILGATVLAGILFWFGGGGKMPEKSTSLSPSSPLRQGFEGQASSEPIVPRPTQNDKGFFDWGGFNEHITIEK